jgi:hypothetical protein
MSVCPRQDEFVREMGLIFPIEDAPVFFQQLGQRDASGQTAPAAHQTGMYVFPFLPRRADDAARLLDGPSAVALKVRIRPREDHRHGQWGWLPLQVFLVRSARHGKKACQRVVRPTRLAIDNQWMVGFRSKVQRRSYKMLI